MGNSNHPGPPLILLQWNPRDLLGYTAYMHTLTHTHGLNTDATCALSHPPEAQEPAG